MTTRTKLLSVLLAITATDGTAPPAPGFSARPDVILILADDLGYGDLGFTGNPVLSTPQLDAMAERSARVVRLLQHGEGRMDAIGALLVVLEHATETVEQLAAPAREPPRADADVGPRDRVPGSSPPEVPEWFFGRAAQAVDPELRWVIVRRSCKRTGGGSTRAAFSSNWFREARRR